MIANQERDFIPNFQKKLKTCNFGDSAISFEYIQYIKRAEDPVDKYFIHRFQGSISTSNLSHRTKIYHFVFCFCSLHNALCFCSLLILCCITNCVFFSIHSASMTNSEHKNNHLFLPFGRLRTPLNPTNQSIRA